MALDLDRMRAKLNNVTGKGDGNRTDFWKPQDGENNIRIVPTSDGDPFKEKFFHYNVTHGGFLCPKKNFGDECPVCDFATKLWNEGTEDSKKMAKGLFAKQRFFSPVLVRGEEEQGVKVWGYGKMAYEKLLTIVLDPDYGDITDRDSGTDIVLNYTVPGTPGSFPKTQLKPRRRPSALCDDAVDDCDELLSSVPDISGIFTRHTSEEVQAMLDEFLSSDSSSETQSSETEKYGSKSKVDAAFAQLMND